MKFRQGDGAELLRRAALPLLLVIVLGAASFFTGCDTTVGEPTEEKPGAEYPKWTKIGDGEYNGFTMPEYMNTKGVFVRKAGLAGPGDIYYVNEGGGKVKLVDSGFDLEKNETAAAKALSEKEGRELPNPQLLYLPARNALLMTDGEKESKLWIYQIESASLELLGDASYTGVDFEEIYNLAFEKYGESAYVYPYSGLAVSPDERWVAFSSNLASFTQEKGFEIYLYDMTEKKEKLLLSGNSAAESYNIVGWTDSHWLLCERRTDERSGETVTGTLERGFFLISPDGEKVSLNLGEGFAEGEMISLQAGNGLITVQKSGDFAGFSVYSVSEDGSLDEILDYTAETGSTLACQVNSRGTQLAYVNAPDPESFAREFHVVSEKGGADRVVEPVRLGDEVTTSFRNFIWVDNDRLLVQIREEWEGQETTSAWLLDLRAADTEENSWASEADRSQGRDAAVMADGYMTFIDRIDELEPKFSGQEGELAYIALDTTDMLWITEAEKTKLLEKLAEKYGAEALNKSYVELKAEGYLTEDGRFADGVLLKITGGWFSGNFMRADEVFKWRSAGENVTVSGMAAEFGNDGWKLSEAGNNE